MKTSLFYLIILLCGTSCYFLDDFYINGPQRRETHNRDSSYLKDPDYGIQDSFISPIVDTSLYFTVITTNDPTLKYYRNFKELFCIKLNDVKCISPDMDTHHIIDGDLYTENSDTEHTYIGKNGKTIIEFEGREYLKGLIPSQDGVYTLSCDRDGDGFTYRKDGKILLRKNSGIVFGSLEDPSYGQNGALYYDNAKIHFCYKLSNGNDKQYFVVKDGIEEFLKDSVSDIDDIKFHKGVCYCCPQYLKAHSVRYGSYWILGQKHYVSGHFTFTSTKSEFYGYCATTGHTLPTKVCNEDAYIYLSENGHFALYNSSQNVTLYSGNDGEITFRDSYLARADCAQVINGKIILGLNSLSAPESYIYLDGETKKLETPGYVSAISVQTNITK